MDLVTLILVPIGAAMLITAVLINAFRQRKKRRCSCKTSAVITGIDHFHRTSQHRAHNYGVYEYEFEGKTYYKRSYVGTTGRPLMGKTLNVYVNPHKPEECIIEGWVSALAIGLFSGFGILLIILGIVIGIVI